MVKQMHLHPWQHGLLHEYSVTHQFSRLRNMVFMKQLRDMFSTGQLTPITVRGS